MRRTLGSLVAIALTLTLGWGVPVQASPGVPMDAEDSVATTDSVEPAVCDLGPFANCVGADLAGRDLTGVDLTGANLTSAAMDKVTAVATGLERATLLMASLHGAILDHANLRNADLTSASIVDASMRAVSGAGMSAPWATMDGTDFTDSDLRGAYFGASTVNGANFAGADLSGADFSNANLFRVTLEGANLTGAVLRGASILGATLDASTDLTGADLSGLTWVDGRVCAEGSIGTCKPESATVDEELPQGAATESIKVLYYAARLGNMIVTCKNNIEKRGSCWESSDSYAEDFKQLNERVDVLASQMQRNYANIDQALTAIIEFNKSQAFVTRYQAVKEDLAYTKVASKKLQEFVSCLGKFADPALVHAKERVCQLSGINGTGEKPYVMTSYEDLFAGASGTPSESMAFAGPAARLYYATLWRFGGEGSYRPTKLNDVGVRLQGNIAGTLSDGRDGLLYANFDWMNNRLLRDQGGRAGVEPAFLPGTFLVDVNEATAFYVDLQKAYFSAAIAALELRAGEGSKEAVLEKNVAGELYSLADIGTGANPKGAFDQQMTNFTFPLATYGVDREEKAPVDQHSNRPERVGFVVGQDGKIYRIQHVYGPSASPRPDRGFTFPSFADLVMFQSSINATGVRIGTIASRYPNTIPAAANAAWWAVAGNSSSRPYLGNPYNALRPGDSVYTRFSVSSLDPQYNMWADLGGALGSPCLNPVRMWNDRPTMTDAFRADRGGYDATIGAFDNQFFLPQGARRVVVDGKRNYEAVVRTGAVPVYTLIHSVKQNPDIYGTGVLWRCGGTGSDQSNAIGANWVSVRAMEPLTLFTRLAVGPVRFESCSELRKADWRGIGLPSAHDAVTAQEKETSPFDTRDNLHRWNANWYRVNAHLDTDGDGIACELTQGSA